MCESLLWLQVFLMSEWLAITQKTSFPVEMKLYFDQRWSRRTPDDMLQFEFQIYVKNPRMRGHSVSIILPRSARSHRSVASEPYQTGYRSVSSPRIDLSQSHNSATLIVNSPDDLKVHTIHCRDTYTHAYQIQLTATALCHRWTRWQRVLTSHTPMPHLSVRPICLTLGGTQLF